MMGVICPEPLPQWRLKVTLNDGVSWVVPVEAERRGGVLPENVNYAVKSSHLLSFLESVPEVAGKLEKPNTKERKFEDVVKSAEQAAVLVLVY